MSVNCTHQFCRNYYECQIEGESDGVFPPNDVPGCDFKKGERVWNGLVVFSQEGKDNVWIIKHSKEIQRYMLHPEKSHVYTSKARFLK